MYNSSIEYSDTGSDPNIVYYNIDIISNRTNDLGIGSDPVIAYKEDRQVPIINDASQYYFSIIRASIDGAGSGLPLLMPIVQIGQSDPNLTVYSISLTAYVGGASNITVQEYIIYEPEAINAPTPSAPLIKQDFTSKYYYVFTFSHWVSLINKAIQKAMTNIQTQLQATYGTLTTKTPRLMYESATNLFQLYCDAYGFGEDDRTSKGIAGKDESFEIYLNSNLYQLLRNFPVEYYGGEPGNSGQTFRIIIENKLGTNVYKDPVGTTYYIAVQDFPSTDSIWSPISSIVFCTSFLPTISEQVGIPVQFTDGNNGWNQTSPVPGRVEDLK